MRGSALLAPGALLALFVLGCPSRSERPAAGSSWTPGLASVPPPPAASSVKAPPAAEPPFAGTRLPTERRHQPQAAARLVDVRAARHAGYVRVVFEFDRELPGYRIRYVEPPVRKCGTGDPTAIAGEARLEVKLYPADAHDQAGAPTVADRERALALGVLKELELTCDFEAETVWVLGLVSEKPYRVLELGSPPRLVVDVQE